MVDDVFAYETNGKFAIVIIRSTVIEQVSGFGGRYVMDDANVPVSSHLSHSFECIHSRTYIVVVVSALPRLLGRESSCVYQNA